MIRQRFYIDGYDWKVFVWYYVDDYYTDEILSVMQNIGCPNDDLKEAYKNLSSKTLNRGLCYSSFRNRASVVVISDTSSPDEFANSYDHEKNHLLRQMEMAIGINPYGEEASYLAGTISQKMFPVAKTFMCECYKRELPRSL
jgi:hypothetical protein